MLDLQMGRRNLSPTQMAYYRGLRYNAEKMTSKEANFLTEGMELKTSEKIAQQFKVDEKTIRRDGDFASGLEKLDIDLRKQVLSGEVKVPKKVIQQLSKTEVVQPISSIEKLNVLVPNPATRSTISSTNTPDQVFNDISKMLKTVQESKSKSHFNQLKQLVHSLESFMID
jgi:DNA-binding CsgD family transcriptional regulator